MENKLGGQMHGDRIKYIPLYMDPNQQYLVDVFETKGGTPYAVSEGMGAFLDTMTS